MATRNIRDFIIQHAGVDFPVQHNPGPTRNRASAAIDGGGGGGPVESTIVDGSPIVLFWADFENGAALVDVVDVGDLSGTCTVLDIGQRDDETALGWVHQGKYAWSNAGTDAGWRLEDSGLGPAPYDNATVNSQAFQLGVDPDFWFSMWLYPTGSQTDAVVWSHENATKYIALRITNNGTVTTIEWAKDTGGGDTVIVAHTFAHAGATPCHVLINMHGGVTSLGINGDWVDSATDHTDYDQFSTGLSDGEVFFFGTTGGTFAGAANYGGPGYADNVKAVLDSYFTDATAPNTYPLEYFGNQPSDANTLVLLHMDDDGGSTFVDSSSYGRTVTKHGTVAQDAGYKRYGTAGALFNGTTSDYLSWADAAEFNLGTGDFTIEGWAKVPDVNQTAVLFWMGDSNTETKRFVVYMLGSGSTGLKWFWKDGSVIVNNLGANGLTANDTWFHWCVQREGDDVYIHFNGVNIDSSTVPGAHSMANWTGNLQLGHQDLSGGELPFIGQMDEVRFSDVARYGAADFTP